MKFSKIMILALAGTVFFSSTYSMEGNYPVQVTIQNETKDSLQSIITHIGLRDHKRRRDY